MLVIVGYLFKGYKENGGSSKRETCRLTKEHSTALEQTENSMFFIIVVAAHPLSLDWRGLVV